MIIYLIVLTIILLISTIIVIVTNSGAGQLSNKKMIFFFLLFAVIIASLGFSGLISGVADSMSYFVLIQVICLGLGYWISYLIKRKKIGGFADEKLTRILFVISIAATGMIGFVFLFNYCNTMGIAPYYSLSVLTFPLPQFLVTAFEAYAAVPQEIYKVWYFPDDGREIDFDKIDTSKIFMLELEFSKSLNDTHLVNSKAKAPLGMMFGDWFMSFIENYNHKFDTDPIQYLDADNTSQGWIFYKKSSFLRAPKFIDPDLSIIENRISEKNVIIARRVGIV